MSASSLLGKPSRCTGKIPQGYYGTPWGSSTIREELGLWQIHLKMPDVLKKYIYDVDLAEDKGYKNKKKLLLL